MATTSSTLATGTTSAGSGGRRGNGTHHGRRTAGLLATAALGLSLLVGGTIMHGRSAAAPVAAPASAPALTVAPRAPLSHDQLLYDGSHPGFVEYLPGAGPSAPPAPASVPALAGARPLDASTNEAFRWDFGQRRPVDASVAAEYRWDFGGVVTAGPVAPAQDHGPMPADASTSAEYRWDFAR